MTELSPLANQSTSFRCGYVAIVGRPNVGKSTLMNALLGVKLSIVAPKPQTTRDSILGILNEQGMQMVLIDTPGWLKPHDMLQSFMKKAILKSLFDDADVMLWLLEPGELTGDDQEFGDVLIKANKPLVVAVNKIDQFSIDANDRCKSVETGLPEMLGTNIPVLKISAKTGRGIAELKQSLIPLLPMSPAYFPTDQITDRWERFYVAELIREQLFQSFHQEVPHASTVVIDEFRGEAGRKDFIRAIVYVETEGQKRIVIGQKGSAIKQVGQASRKEIETCLGRPVFLEINVKVKKNWRKDPEFIKSLTWPFQGSQSNLSL